MSAWRFALVADTHLGQGNRAGVHNPSSGEHLAGRMRRLGEGLADCDFALHVGDLIEDGTAGQMAQAAAILADWPCPTYLCLGNHDACAPGDRERWPEHLPAALPGGTGPYAFDHGGLHFAVLHTWWEDREGVVRPYWERQGQCRWQVPDDQLSWLDSDLAAHRGRPTIVVHHPLSIPLSARLTGTEATHHPARPETVAELDAVLDGHPQVFALFGGHAHAHQIERAGGRWHVATACLPEFPYEYRVATVEAGRLVIATRGLPADDGMLPAEQVPHGWVAGRESDRRRELPL